MRFGVPVTEYDSVNFGMGLERNDITLDAASPARYVDYVNLFGARSDTIRGSFGYGRDTRDSIYFPSRGYLLEAGAEAGLPGGDVKYYRIQLHAQWLKPIWGPIVLSANAEYGLANGYGGKSLPFFKNFYAGGVDSVRGYEQSSLGPRDTNNQILGGNQRFVSSLELLFPLPGTKTDKSVRLSAFVDAGNIFGKDFLGRQQKFYINDMKASVGVAVSWFSPVGPLKFSLAKPLNPRPEDKIERFQFLLGRAF